DLRPLLERESELWMRRLAWDYTPSAEMILRYLDSKILPGYAAIERGRVFGYCFFVYEGSKGVIGDLFVATNNGYSTAQQVSEVEQQLLAHVIDTLQSSPGVHRVEAQLLMHSAGSASAPFVREGFARYQRLFMTLPVTVEQQPLRQMSSDFEIRPWREQDYQAAAGLITAAYRNHVDSEINDQYRTLSGSLRFLNNIVRFPGCGTFDPEASFVVLHKPSKATVGMILTSRVKDDVGHVTQVCLMPEYRSQGIGEALIAATRANLRKRGFNMLSLTVTEANKRAVALYIRLGFRVQHVFDAFVWEG
ncbi:MAG TPA: N-acetyltransferase, partial [Terriglobales bacterium]|nr:N-acetyltransferase [Terriglobales bacterium]